MRRAPSHSADLASAEKQQSGTSGRLLDPRAASDMSDRESQTDVDAIDPVLLGTVQLPTPEITTSQPQPSAPMAAEDSFFPDFLKDVLTDDLDQFAMPNAHQWQHQGMGPRDVLDFAGEANWDFETADFNILEALNGRPIANLQFYPDPSELGQAIDQGGHLPHSQGGTDTPKRVALGTKAFEKSSFGRWRPGKKDSAFSEQHNLSLPREQSGSPDTRLRCERPLLRESLDQSARDQILALVLSTCEPANVSRVAASFPTVELLDDLLQSFFIRQSSQTDCFIHVASFNPSQAKPEVLTAMVATGAVLSGVRPLQKLGFAILEAVRAAIPKRCEECNAVTRQLWILQAFMLQLEVGLWSGNRRKMELSESHLQILVTMIRRAGKLQRDKRLPVAPLPQDAGEDLQRKWLEWVERESVKRLVFHVFLYDAQSSMSLLANPLVSYAEVAIALPESKELWDAEDAEQWKAIYLSRREPAPDRLPSLVDCIQEPASIVSSQAFCDAHFSTLISLHAFWGMIWEYNQMDSITKNRTGQSNDSLFMPLRNQGLCRTLQYFRMSMSECKVPPSPESMLVLDILLMYLHMSLEEIQLFAGKEDKDEARRVFPSLQQWVESSGSRQAIWHGGQVLRAAKTFPRNQLRNFYAIAVYHASIAFWAFGVISQAKTNRLQNTGSFTDVSEGVVQPIWLDGSETPDVQRFIALGRGNPGICALPSPNRTNPTLVPLTDPEAVMDIMLDTLRKNCVGQAPDEALPPLVENLAQLMRDLGKAAEAMGR